MMLDFSDLSPVQNFPRATTRFQEGIKTQKNTAHWQVGCLGITDPCSSECEASFTTCMEGGDTSSASARTETFADCIENNLDGCAEACAPTFDMLKQSETPTTVKYDNFGTGTGEPSTEPSGSLCQV